MAKWMHHEEHAMVEDAVKAYRDRMAGTVIALPVADDEVQNLLEPGETLARRIEMAVRSTDWRVVENRRA